MYHESSFSLRQGRSRLSARPIINSLCIKEPPVWNWYSRSTGRRLRQLLRAWFVRNDDLVFIQCPGPFSYKMGFSLSALSALRENGLVDHADAPGYGTVLYASVCSIDPVEAGAEFHEDSLEDRPRYAFAYKKHVGWSWAIGLLGCVTFGFTWLLFRWMPVLHFLLTHSRTHFLEATDVVVCTEKGEENLAEIRRCPVVREEAEAFDCWPPFCAKCGSVVKPQAKPQAKPPEGDIACHPCAQESSSWRLCLARKILKSVRRVLRTFCGFGNVNVLELQPEAVEASRDHIKSTPLLWCHCETNIQVSNPRYAPSYAVSLVTRKFCQLIALFCIAFQSATLILFEFRLVRHYLNLWDNAFEVAQLNSQLPPHKVHNRLGRGIRDMALYVTRKRIFQPSEESATESSFVSSVVEEVTGPFYVFQLLSIALWFWDEYTEYAVLVLCLTVLSSCYDLWSARSSEQRILRLKLPPTSVTVFRSFNTNNLQTPLEGNRRGAYENTEKGDGDVNELPYGEALYTDDTWLSSVATRIPASDLQPGDLFEVEPDTTVACDAAVLWGSAVVTETALSGEPIPLVKVPLQTDFAVSRGPKHRQRSLTSDSCRSLSTSSLRLWRFPHMTRTSVEVKAEEVLGQWRPTKGRRRLFARGGSVGVSTTYKIDQDTHCSLYASTRVLAVHPSPLGGRRVLAVAVRTGYLCCHGRLLRSLLFPSSLHSHFNIDAMVYIRWLLLYCSVGALISVATGWLYGFEPRIIFIRSADLFTDAIPPALPAVLSIGIAVAIQRLRSQYHIDCINAGRMNPAGEIDTFVFDKTGTLTKSGLEFRGCFEVENVVFPSFAPTRGRQNASLGLDTLFYPTSTARRSQRTSPPQTALRSTSSKPLGAPLEPKPQQNIASVTPSVVLPDLPPAPSSTASEPCMLASSGTRAPPKRLGPNHQPRAASGACAFRRTTSGDMRIRRLRLGPRRLKVDQLGLRFVQALATCHSLSLVEGKPSGDPMELCLLEFTGWTLRSSEELDIDPAPSTTYSRVVDQTVSPNASSFGAALAGFYDSGPDLAPLVMTPRGVHISLLNLLRCGHSRTALLSARSMASSGTSNANIRSKPPPDSQATLSLRKYFPGGHSELGILRRFHFSSALQRLTVIVRDPLTQELFAFCKGAPDIVADLCLTSSVPPFFQSAVSEFTRKGARVIAVAGKPLGRLRGSALGHLRRQDVETKLTLLGYLVFANRLKPDTQSALTALKNAGCRCILATGDTPLTALAVSRECGIVRSTGTTHQRPPRAFVLGDLYVPKSNGLLADSRVGQRSYFVWTKIGSGTSTGAVSTTSAAASLRPEGTENLVTPAFVAATGARPMKHDQSPSTARADPEARMRRMLTAHTRKTMTLDLRDFLRGKNPRDFEFILTGRAFRRLRMLHEELQLPWFGQECVNSETSTGLGRTRAVRTHHRERLLNAHPENLPLETDTSLQVSVERKHEKKSLSFSLEVSL